MIQTNSNNFFVNFAENLKIGVLLIIFGIFGDLFNAFWKRIMGIKDSSAILGSHGGIHDRFGSVIFALILSEYFNLEFNFSMYSIIAVLALYMCAASIHFIYKHVFSNSSNTEKKIMLSSFIFINISF